MTEYLNTNHMATLTKVVVAGLVNAEFVEKED